MDVYCEDGLHHDCDRMIAKLKADYAERQRAVEWWNEHDKRVRAALIHIISLLALDESPHVAEARQLATNALHPSGPAPLAALSKPAVDSLFKAITPARAQDILATFERRMEQTEQV